MAFQIKDFTSIVASCINWMKATTNKITDFNIGSVARTMVEAPAAEMDELYQQMFIGLREAIPTSVYNSFSFSLIEAVPASGLIRVSIASSSSDVFIPAGTTFVTPINQITYASSQDATITAGSTYADVLVTAETAGAAGNVPAASTFTPSPTPDQFVSASNQVAFVNGIDQETEDQRKVRFNAFISSLNRGTVAALEYGVKTTVLRDTSGNELERVVSTSIVEPWIADNTQPVSLVNCYVHNGTGGTSSSLVTQARSVLYGYYDANGNAVPGWKAAGVQVEVYAATEQTLNVTATLTALAGYVKADLVTQAQNALAQYIKDLDIGVSAILSEMIAIAMGITGVYNFVVSSPSGDTTAANNVKLMPGTITIT